MECKKNVWGTGLTDSTSLLNWQDDAHLCLQTNGRDAGSRLAAPGPQCSVVPRTIYSFYLMYFNLFMIVFSCTFYSPVGSLTSFNANVHSVLQLQSLYPRVYLLVCIYRNS